MEIIYKNLDKDEALYIQSMVSNLVSFTSQVAIKVDGKWKIEIKLELATLDKCAEIQAIRDSWWYCNPPTITKLEAIVKIKTQILKKQKIYDTLQFSSERRKAEYQSRRQGSNGKILLRRG